MGLFASVRDSVCHSPGPSPHIPTVYNPKGPTPYITPALTPRGSLSVAAENPHLLNESNSTPVELRKLVRMSFVSAVRIYLTATLHA